MMRRFILFVFTLIFSLTAFSQVDTSVYAEFEDEDNQVIYWEEGYYDSIPKETVLISSPHQSFDEISKRYRGNEFEYIDRISDEMNFVSRFFDRIGRIFGELFPTPSFGYYQGLYDFLVIVGAIFLVICIYRYAFSKHSLFIKHPKEIPTEEALSFVEQNLMDVDVNFYIEEALKNGDYSLAVRYHQLLNIQQLQKRDLILWDRTKTNYELLNSIQDVELRKDFLSCTRIYDYVWFGSFSVDIEEYKTISSQFEGFRRKWL